MSPPFAIERHDDPDGAVRLTLRGELDIATAGELRDALEHLRTSRVRARLDLSRIDFVDSSGLAVIVAAKRHATGNGWGFEIDPAVAPTVRRLFELAGVETFLWR